MERRVRRLPVRPKKVLSVWKTMAMNEVPLVSCQKKRALTWAKLTKQEQNGVECVK